MTPFAILMLGLCLLFFVIVVYCLIYTSKLEEAENIIGAAIKVVSDVAECVSKVCKAYQDVKNQHQGSPSSTQAPPKAFVPDLVFPTC
jgi:hypothetical protein